MDADTGSMRVGKKLSDLKRYQMVFVLFIVFIIAYIDRVNVSILVVDPAFLSDMGLENDPFGKGLLMTLFLLFCGGAMLFLAPIGDKIGPKKTVLIASVIMAASMLVGGFANTMAVMLFSRAILGVGEGLMCPMQSSFVKNWFPINERGKANAIWLLGINFAPIIAIPIFVWMIPALGWRESFYFLAILGLVPLVLIGKYTTDHPRQYKNISKAELEYIESALEKEKESINNAACASTWENAMAVMQNHRVWLLTAIYTGSSSIYWGIMTWLPSYLRDARGFSWNEMGFLASLPFVLSIAAKAVSGLVIDRRGYTKKVLLAGTMGSALTIYSAAYIHNNIAAALLIAGCTASVAMVTPCAWKLLQSVVDAGTISTASGFMNGISSVISAASPVMIGLAISWTDSYIGGLMYLVGWGVVSIVSTFLLMRDRMIRI